MDTASLLMFQRIMILPKRVVYIQQAAMIEGRVWSLLSLLRAVRCNSPKSAGQLLASACNLSQGTQSGQFFEP